MFEYLRTLSNVISEQTNAEHKRQRRTNNYNTMKGSKYVPLGGENILGILEQVNKWDVSNSVINIPCQKCFPL